jgi:peptidoglycan/LPS O-acetylase OafA/YrhL
LRSGEGPAPGSRPSALDLNTQRPSWLPAYIPELQGLRGLAVLAVVVYHCHPRLAGTWLYTPALWGWAGVNLFFVLSGFLITCILLDSRGKERYFRNFYARRALRIWPVYLLVLVVCYLNAPWFVGLPVWAAIRSAPWWAYLLFLQNLFRLAIPPAINQTWSLAIEEQYYFLWAPIVRFVRPAVALAFLLGGIVLACPLMRLLHPHWLTPTHTLIHLDGIALGSLISIGLYTVHLRRRTWLWIGLSSLVIGIAAAATIAGGTAFLDSALALAFGGAVLAAIASTSARTSDRSSRPTRTFACNPIHAVLSRGPLAFYGRISYGLYMIHIGVFIYFGWFDLKMDPYGVPGNLAIVAFRLAMATLFATALWYGFEKQILKLKCYF